MVNSGSQTSNPYVKARNVPWPPPNDGDTPEAKASRVLPKQVWSLEDFRNCAARYLAGDKIALNAITRAVSIDMQAAKLQYKDVAKLIMALTQDNYLNSFWCKASPRRVPIPPDEEWYPCDAYCIETAHPSEDEPDVLNKYYLKMSRSATNGRTLLMVSMHESEYE
jgi:hypothetical protein